MFWLVVVHLLYLLLPLCNNINVELQGVVERCSFEQGLCSWTRSDVDTPEAEWTRHKGERAWPKLGPHRDHTQNSAAGKPAWHFKRIHMSLDSEQHYSPDDWCPLNDFPLLTLMLHFELYYLIEQGTILFLGRTWLGKAKNQRCCPKHCYPALNAL